jgi:F5/8 type C domain
MGYIVGDAESGVWQRALEAYGARFVRRDLGGVVLFDEIGPQPKGTPLSPDDWTVEASDGRGSAPLAVDGRLDTRWGSHAPQRPGMTFTIGFPRPTDVSWLKIRMGRFATDRARGLVVETSIDGERWNRLELPAVVDGIRWRDGVPEENADGDLDLWVNASGLRALRLVGRGESSRFDWSIAEVEIEEVARR